MSYSRCSIKDNDITFRPFSSLLSLELPYHPPTSPLGAWLWKWRLWLEITFGASVLSPGEKIAFIVVWSAILSLLILAVVSVIPQALTAMYGRTLFYIFGADAARATQLYAFAWNGTTAAAAAAGGSGTGAW
ncbi:hypothetical protein K488DRAFT_71491 [Vararia minispora EC-137]|uniref:Uncharacterized protein n=1 Tax=Vararia minispora EC-137 TaxID=1314806 RepID=A0ACB8QJ35_9AGAM|nr:hypothetical protein K488DRAFT_71491 [Vararia minispora EC-137]